jgi:hypothetical protein
MLRTTPVFSSTRRCLVIAWLVNLEPPANCVIERRCPPQSLATSDNRVSSPSAAKLGVCALRAAGSAKPEPPSPR